MKVTLSSLRLSLYILTLGTILSPLSSGAAVGTAIASGNWNSSSTWSINGVNRMPACGDTLTIPSSRTVTVNNQSDLSACSNHLFITVGGTLQFTNGNKLSLPCNSTVDVLLNGIIKKATAGGGNSTFIEICGTVEWKAGDGQLNGPATLGGYTLPITLLYFKASNSESAIDLTWTTSSEINNDYFTIERSLDGEQFSALKHLPGAGNSNTNLNYTCRDERPVQGRNYYRLKQTDFDGNYSYSDPVAVNYSNAGSFELIAVSADENSLLIFLNDPEGGLRQLVVTRSDGRIEKYAYLETQAGKARYELSACYFSSGIYTLKLLTNEQAFSKKFLFE